ncbi:LamB/YcsF family protein [Bacillus pacificus]
MTTIDLNCDLGEKFGAYKMGNDDEILPFVSSINVAAVFMQVIRLLCGKRLKKLCSITVAIGAHPGFSRLNWIW